MAQQTLNNGDTGLLFRTKLNENFTELYTKANYCVGYYDTMALLQAAHPVGIAGQWALVGNPSNPDKPYMVIWDVDTNAWTISGITMVVASFNGRTGAVSSQSGDYSAFYDAIGAASAAVSAHLGAFAHGDIALNSGHRLTVTGNPHAVTKTEVGLGNVANVAQVTSVTASAPLASSGGTTPAISIPAATNASDGYATMGHIQAIEANTLKVTNATHTGDVTGSTGLTIANKQTVSFTAPLACTQTITVISAGGAPTVSMPAATASSDGYATAAQITALTAVVSAAHARSHALNSGSDHTGTLDAAQLPTGGNWALSSGLVINSGAAAVDITINRKTSGKAFYYNATNDVMDGDFLACTSTSGSPLRHVSLGHGVQKVAYSVVIGYNAGNAGSSGQNVIIGDSAGSGSTAQTLTAVGRFAGQNAGQGTVAIGHSACQDSSGQLNTTIGNSALKGASANASSQTVAIGSSALANVTGVNYGVAVGTSAGSALTTSRNFILLGHNAGDFETSTYGVLHIDGYGNDRVDVAGGRANAIIYGVMTTGGSTSQTLAFNAVVTVKHTLTVNTSAGAYDFIVNRVTSGTAFRYNGTPDRIEGDFLWLTGAPGYVAQTIVGFAAGNRGIMTGADNACIHYGSGASLTTGSDNILIGKDAGSKLIAGGANVFIGTTSGRYQTGYNSVGVGVGALAGALGASTGNYNTAFGNNAGGLLTTGEYNIFLGNNAGVNHTTESGRLVVDAYVRASQSAEQANSLIYGIMASAGAASQSIQFNVASLITPAASYQYFGDTATDGTWRIGRSGSDLVIERRESGSYVTKQTISA